MLTIGPVQDPPEVYFWWRFRSPPLDRGPADLPRPYDDLMVATQISPRRYVGDVAAYLFLDGRVKTMPFAQTWGDASTNLHYPFKQKRGDGIMRAWMLRVGVMLLVGTLLAALSGSSVRRWMMATPPA